ncbi:MAG: hypothetical protein C4576_25315 [Desulfobacteraceae bacterium]|nr:MAG: hypothetical protein C4576_25315 [Desulfobacteraceae bacterium]
MTPLSFEWKWIADYFIFMGLLYLALGIVVCGLAFVYIRTWLDLYKAEKGETVVQEIPARLKYTQY